MAAIPFMAPWLAELGAAMAMTNPVGLLVAGGVGVGLYLGSRWVVHLVEEERKEAEEQTRKEKARKEAEEQTRKEKELHRGEEKDIIFFSMSNFFAVWSYSHLSTLMPPLK
jgi:hypothetical protein